MDFIRITKRDNLSRKKEILITLLAIVLSIVFAGIILLIFGLNPFEIFKEIIMGSVGTGLRVKQTIVKAVPLIITSMGIIVAFKMKFWNCGAEGQVLIGGLATVAVMMFLGDKLPLPILLIIMIAASIIASIIWAVLPAIFKAYWNTNETLFTLMMNYVAIQFVSYFLKSFVKTGSGVLFPMPEFGLPVLFGKQYLLNIIIVAVMTVLVYIYLKYTKQGYEISVVGESENTANYIGINVKKVIIRTLVVSGALCGIAGLLLVGGTNHTINVETAGGRGFTAIMVSWLAKFNPIFMVFTSFLIVFLQKGASQVSTDFRLPQAISDIVTGIILFFIIGCEFFLNYKIVVTKSVKEEK